MTNFDKKLFTEWGNVFASGLVAFVLLLLACVMCGCKTQYVPVETVRTQYNEADTTAIYNRLLRIFESRKEKESRSDSLIDQTKETVVLNEQGDTTRHDKERIIYKATSREKELEVENKTLRDSISVLNTRLESIKTDSTPSIVTVERVLSRWERAKMTIGGITMIAVIAIVAYALIAWLVKKCRK